MGWMSCISKGLHFTVCKLRPAGGLNRVIVRMRPHYAAQSPKLTQQATSWWRPARFASRTTEPQSAPKTDAEHACVPPHLSCSGAAPGWETSQPVICLFGLIGTLAWLKPVIGFMQHDRLSLLLTFSGPSLLRVTSSSSDWVRGPASGWPRLLSCSAWLSELVCSPVCPTPMLTCIRGARFRPRHCGLGSNLTESAHEYELAVSGLCSA